MPKTSTASRGRTAELTYIALLAVLTVICTWITIPLTIPFTMQTFAVSVSLGLLGGKRGILAFVVYLLLGFAGLPVFSGFRAGAGVLFGATGGYLLGFLAMGLLYLLLEKWMRGRLWAMALVLTAGLLLCYACGTLWFMQVYVPADGPVTLMAALGMCVFPFVLPDLVKIGLSLLAVRQLRPHVKL